MKKNLLLLLSAAALCLVLYACSQAETEVPETRKTEQVERTAFDDLNLQIAMLNAQYPGEASRGLGWKRFRRILGADVFGAAIGGLKNFSWFGALIGGVSASIIESTKLREEGVIKPQKIYSASPALTREDSIGIYHNQFILDLYEAKGEAFFTLTPVQIRNYTLTTAERRFGKLSYKDMQSLTSSTRKIDEFLNSNAIGETTWGLVCNNATASAPTQASEMEVITNYCTQIELLPTVGEKQSYTTAFCTTVSQSGIPIDSKANINAAVRVGENSSLLWMLDATE